MRVVLGSLLLLLCMACQDSAEDVAASHDQIEPVVEDVATEADPALDAGADDPPKGPPLDASKARAFLTYQEQLIPFLKQLQQAGAQYEQGAPGGGLDRAIGAMQGAGEINARFGESVAALETARKSVGLSEADVSALMEIEAGVLSRGAGTGIATQIDELEKSLATLDPVMRADAEKSLQEMKEARDSLLSLSELRATYGDAIVDAMIALQPELSRQFEGLSQTD